MAKPPKKYLECDKYKIAANTLDAVSGMVLFSFAKYECDTKNIIIRNFIARASMMLKAIFRLWEISDYQDAWSIYRTLLDRLFHLYHLSENKEFIEFDKWSFYKQYNSQNKVRSDKNFKHEAVGWEYELTKEQKMRMKKLIQNPPKWKRPKPEIVAKQMGLECFYKYGYDFASTHVHPMSNDGQEDFFTITKLKPSIKFPDWRCLLSNSILTNSSLLHLALNNSSFKWRCLLWDYVEHIQKFVNEGDEEYQETFLKLTKMFPATELCEQVTP